MLILMCKDTMVYNLETEEVYSKELLPGIMTKTPCTQSFDLWQEGRYSSNTNSYARSLRGLTFGLDSRDKINTVTREFSLSDCYWIKDISDRTSFKQLTPYCNDYWKGEEPYVEGAVPTLYVNGVRPKFWENGTLLVKHSNAVEVECLELANKLGMDNCCHGKIIDENKIGVNNFTDTDRMFEPASFSGKLNPEDFTDDTIIDLLQETGIDTVIIDAIVGNGDRHAGNFGFLRSSETGEYLGAAPIFDFDHALDSQIHGKDILISSAASALCNSDKGITRLHQIYERSKDIEMRESFRTRLEALNKLLH